MEVWVLPSTEKQASRFLTSPPQLHTEAHIHQLIATIKKFLGGREIITPPHIKPPDIPSPILVELFKLMVLIRRFEEKIIDVYGLQDMKSPVHLCIGQEGIATGVCAHLEAEDYIFTTHRSHGHCLAKGMDPKELYAECYGRVTGCCRGKGGSMHPAAPALGIPGATSIVGGSIPLAAGAALSFKKQGNGKISVAFFGDGAADQGVFHESLNFAALKKLPVLFVCENNYYATNSPLSARQPHPDIYLRAAGYGIPGLSVDGNDVLEVYQAAQEAVRRARRGDGPTLLECKTYRWRGHVGPECDWEKGCRPREELMDWMSRCPIESLLNRLILWGIIDQEWSRQLHKEVDDSLDQAIKFARDSAFPATEELYQHIYYEKKS
jgi:TPP-dependent pyruvate/acetoin dehydrogenase alpha subunit